MKIGKKRSCCLYDLRTATFSPSKETRSFHASIPLSFDRSLLGTYGFRTGGLAANEFSSSSLVGREIPQVVPSTVNARVCSFRLARTRVRLSAVSLARGNVRLRRSRNRSYGRENPIFSTGSLNPSRVNREALSALCI